MSALSVLTELFALGWPEDSVNFGKPVGLSSKI